MLFDLRCLYSSGNAQPLPVGIRVSPFFLDGSDIFFLFSVSSCFTWVYNLIKKQFCHNEIGIRFLSF